MSRLPRALAGVALGLSLSLFAPGSAQADGSVTLQFDGGSVRFGDYDRYRHRGRRLSYGDDVIIIRRDRSYGRRHSRGCYYGDCYYDGGQYFAPSYRYHRRYHDNGYRGHRHDNHSTIHRHHGR